MSHVVQQGHSAGGGSGLALVASNQPVADVASVEFTGLSSYSIVRIVYALQLVSTATLNIEARVSGGTWRSITGPSITAGQAAIGYGEFVGFGSTNDVKVFNALCGTLGASIDSSDAMNSTSGLTNTPYTAAPSWNESWDEIRIIASTGNIEGSAADDRGYVYVYAG
jgi:hypothetical protein